MMALHVQPELRELIKTRQLEDPFLTRIGNDIEMGKPSEFQKRVDGSIWFRNRICVPSNLYYI